MTVIHTVRDWLLLVGDQYNIDEAWHIYRPDNDNVQRRPHFVYWFENAIDGAKGTPSMNCSTTSGNDVNEVLIRPRLRTLVVRCVDDENGMSVLESLSLSVEHPAIQNILVHGSDGHNGTDAASRIVILEDVGIDNETENDETDIEHAHTMRFTVRLHARFSLTNENALFDDLELTGKVYKSDDVSEIPITITD